MNWFMPAFVSSRPDSGGGISDELGTRVCPRSSKNDRNARGSGGLPRRGVYRRVRRRAGRRARRSRRAGRCRRAAGPRARPSPACPPAIDSETSFERSSRPPLASRARVCGATRCACFLVQRQARMAPVAPAPRPSATQNPRFTVLRPPLARANALAQAGAHADDLHERARGRLLGQAGELLDPAHDLGGRDPASCRRGRARGSSAPPYAWTSRSSGTISSRIVSIVIRVLSSTRKVLMQHDAAGPGPARPQKAATIDEGGVAAGESPGVSSFLESFRRTPAVRSA